ncbi:MAG: 5-methyltetrahydrofolate--homocysteine methyltransferase, partial [Limisphaerales bacterium]
DMMRARHAEKKDRKQFVSLDQARANGWSKTSEDYIPPKPVLEGVKVFNDYDLETLVSYIDWTPFFMTWELAGRYPAILKDEVVGEHATELFDDAKALLKRIVDEKLLEARAVIGIFPASREGDDVIIWQDENRNAERTRLHFMRQQNKKAAGQPNRCLADFVSVEKPDWIGSFAVTAGFNIEKTLKVFELDNDDYQSILLKALADRLAEAFAEHMHERVRKEFWAYAPEILDNESLISEKYKGIRPAPGYPACPDHTEKATLWNLMDVETEIGIKLTESYAMYPAASVSGWYFSHPDSTYFGVGKIAKDQVDDLALRKGLALPEMERWLKPVLNYD